MLERYTTTFSPLFDQFFTTAPVAKTRNTRWPAIDVQEEEENFTVTADIPGVKKEDLEIKVEDGYLMLAGERHTENSYYNERTYGKFVRKFWLNKKVDADKITAKLNDGVLKIVLPKADKPKSIAISVN